jgi:hypothetical protein
MGTTTNPKSAERTAETIKNIALDIRDASIKMKETVSGAIEVPLGIQQRKLMMQPGILKSVV